MERTSRAKSDSFIVLFLSLLLLIFATDSKVWPFMAYDMYSHSYGSLRFQGVTRSGEVVSLSADQYFKYYQGSFFLISLFGLKETQPQKFAEIMRTLKLRYNQSAAKPIEYLQVFCLREGKTEFVGKFL